MKTQLVILIAFGLLLVPMVALAGVAGSDHDLSGTGGSELCQACHIPHNALGEKLWARNYTGSFSGVQALCHSCHDGSVTAVGSTTAFDANKEQHATVGADCSGGGACHDVHNQNPNVTGKFTVAEAQLTNGSYCETCHDATEELGAALGDHTAGLTHFTNGTTFTCNQCHTIHGAVTQTTNPSGLNNPILLADNTDGYYGSFCVSCHNGTAPAEAATGTGGVASSDPLDYAMATVDGTETKHPSIEADNGFGAGGCDRCHDVHDHTVTPAPKYILKVDNTDSNYCETCHDGASGPNVGANTHYTGLPADNTMNSGLTPALPWANQIDEDGTAGSDWPTATANHMGCETCHSVHRQGFTGAGANYFLRHANSDQNEICGACHTDN